MAEINEELRVLVTAEVDKAIKNLKKFDSQTSGTMKMLKSFGAAVGAAFSAKAVVDFVKGCADAYAEEQQTLRLLASTIETTGAAAWTSTEELAAMAQGLQDVTNYSGGAINSMQTVLLGFKNVKGDNFEHATKAILDMATVMKMDLASAAQTVGKALDDPINGLASLQRQGFRFTEAQKKLIQSFLDVGDAAAAQKVILDELDGTYAGAAHAAVSYATQVKNAFADVMTSIGGFLGEGVDRFKKLIAPPGDGGLSWIDKAGESLSKGLGSMWDYNKEAGVVVNSLNLVGAAFKNTWSTVDRATDFEGWYNGLDAAKKMEHATGALAASQAEYNKALKDGKDISDQLYALDFWRHEVESLKYAEDEQRRIIQQESDRANAESQILELMSSVGDEYERLAKDDPVIQVERYREQLKKLDEDRKKLISSASDKNGTIIDTSGAIRELDYVESAIKKKMSSIGESKSTKKSSKKSWQEWLSDILDVDRSLFSTGKQAAELYKAGLEESLSDSEAISRALGEPFNRTDFLDNQLSDIKGKIQEALSIDPAQINSAFSPDELDKTNTALGTLKEQYLEIKNARNEAFVGDELEKLQKELDDAGKSELDLYLAMLKANGATDEQIEKARELKNAIEDAKQPVKEEYADLAAMIGGLTTQALDNLGELDKKSTEIIGSLATSLSSVSFSATLSSFQEFGKALGEGKDAADSMHSALASMAQEILNQLPLLMMQAGLQLIAQGQWALGLGFIMGGFADSLISGYVSGKTEKNAFGGVYGADDYSAFAKGGTFTNSIVQSPTFFKFAKGSGFGTGLMGEAGPEAVMPLTRGVDGSLGVSASGIGGGDYSLTVVINNYGSENVTAEETSDETGQRRLEVTIGSMINSHLSGGKADKAMKARYGLKAQGV